MKKFVRKGIIYTHIKHTLHHEYSYNFPKADFTFAGFQDDFFGLTLSLAQTDGARGNGTTSKSRQG